MRKLIISLLALLVPFIQATVRADEAPVVVVSSYNPDVRNISEIIGTFNETYNETGCKTPVVLENMNCMNLTESPKWKPRLRNLLNKYYKNGKKPAVIVLLGIEASTTFLSMKDSIYKETPIILGLRSNSMVELPDSSVDLAHWEPEVHYINRDYADYNIVGGCIYRYNISKNFELMQLTYPKTDSLVFISDNTLGGVTMQAHFREIASKSNHYHVDYLDGRTHSLFEVNDTLASLSPNHIVVIGTWRIDSFDNYTMSNSTYTLAKNAPTLPAITLSSVGKGHWAFGGYVPRYSNSGARLANAVVKYLRTGVADSITMMPSSYFYDYQKAKELKIDTSIFGDEYEVLNEPVSFLERHWLAILGVALIFTLLCLGLFFSLYYLRRTRKLSNDLKQQSQSLAKALTRAEEANKMKSQFIASMSHEIRTPLNAVVGFSQILTSEGMEISDEEKQEITSRIILNTDLLLKLINDILDFSRMEAGKGNLNIKEVEFVGLMQMATDSARVNLQEGVEIHCVSNVPELKVQTDPARMTQVFSNLLSNAKKCTEKGSITVSLDYTPGQPTYLVSVTDTGCGIPADKAETIFQRFAKLDEFRQGTGLGLSIVRAIIEQLGGSIWLDTSYIGGARFTFRQPISQSNAK